MEEEVQEWVTKYYKEFNENPARVMKLYHIQPVYTRNMKKTPGKDGIVVELTSRENYGAQVDVDKIKTDYLFNDQDEDMDGGIIVNAWGEIQFPGSYKKQKFSQVFRLVVNKTGRLLVLVTILSVHEN